MGGNEGGGIGIVAAYIADNVNYYSITNIIKYNH